jgi:hypothetical protein
MFSLTPIMYHSDRRFGSDAQGEKERKEIIYGLANLTREKANASRLLALQQAHYRSGTWPVTVCKNRTMEEAACYNTINGTCAS